MVVMVGEEVPLPKEAMIDWPSVQLIRMTVEEEEDWWFLEVDLLGNRKRDEEIGEVKEGRVNFGVVKSLLGKIPEEVMGDSGGETFGVDGGAVW
ncbi:hypothetical protein Tco_0320645 [Tanacetum coccineum]